MLSDLIIDKTDKPMRTFLGRIQKKKNSVNIVVVTYVSMNVAGHDLTQINRKIDLRYLYKSNHIDDR